MSQEVEVQKTVTQRLANANFPSMVKGALAPGAYMEYVRTAKARERRWRTFSISC